MKICHLTSVHSHTDTRIFLKECKSLVQAGYEVHFVVPGSESVIMDGVHIHGVEKVGNRLTRMTNTVSQVFKKALQIDADIYHFHDSELIPVGMKLKRKGKKVIYDIHEDLPRAILSKKWISPYMRKPMSRIVETFEDHFAKKFDCLIAATPYISERFQKINAQTITVNNYPLLGELKKSSNAKFNRQVSYVGGLNPIRGLSQLVKTADLIDGELHIAGPIHPEEIIGQFKQYPNIKYHGILNRNDVKELLSQSMAGLVTFLPEPNHINAQPNKLFEYMSAGIPVICSDFPLWRAIIDKYNCGICVDPENPKEIAEAINYLFENPEVASSMGKNGRRAVEEEYNWEQESVLLVEAYRYLRPLGR